MTCEAFKFAEREGWDARVSGYDTVKGQVTTAAIPTLLAMAGTASGKRILDLCCGTGRGLARPGPRAPGRRVSMLRRR